MVYIFRVDELKREKYIPYCPKNHMLTIISHDEPVIVAQGGPITLQGQYQILALLIALCKQ